MLHSHSSVCCQICTTWVPSKQFFVLLAVAEVYCLVTVACVGSLGCILACFVNWSHNPCFVGIALDTETSLTEIVLVRIGFGL
jgi:hypothetical protein